MRDGGKPWPSTQGRAHSRYSVEGGEQLNDGAGGWLKDKQNQSKSASQAGLAKLSSPPLRSPNLQVSPSLSGKGPNVGLGIQQMHITCSLYERRNLAHPGGGGRRWWCEKLFSPLPGRPSRLTVARRSTNTGLGWAAHPGLREAGDTAASGCSQQGHGSESRLSVWFHPG